MPEEEEGGLRDYQAWLRKNSGWCVVIGGLILLIVALFSMAIDSRRKVVALERQQLSVAQTAVMDTRTPQSPLGVLPTLSLGTPTVDSGTPASASSLTEAEKHPVATGNFPSSAVQGPAIVQWWDGGSRCGVFLLRQGETLAYEGQGTWWQFASQAAADARYPAHRAEYFISNQGCHEGKPGE